MDDLVGGLPSVDDCGVFGHSQRWHDLRDQFVTATGASPRTAMQWLRQCLFNLENAVDEYISNGGYVDPSCDPTNPLTRNYIDERLVKIFNEYASKEDPNIMDIDGTNRFMQWVRTRYYGATKLHLAWILESPSQDVYTKHVFCTKLRQKGAYPIVYIELLFAKVEEDLFWKHGFAKEIYLFTYHYIKPKGAERVETKLALSYHSQLLRKSRGSWKYGTMVDWWLEFVKCNEPEFDEEDWAKVWLFFEQDLYQDPGVPVGYKRGDWPDVVQGFVTYLEKRVSTA